MRSITLISRSTRATSLTLGPSGRSTEAQVEEAEGADAEADAAAVADVAEGDLEGVHVDTEGALAVAGIEGTH